jgi:hypothetical protein
MNWDGNYAYSLAAFIVGALAGFQAIYDQYKDESGSALNTFPGYAYLLSRGIVPAIVFVILYRTYQVRSYLLGLAIGLGLGTEAVLRSQFQLKSSRPAKGALTTENTFVGFFNLLEWYQNFFLELIRIRLTRKRQTIVQDAVRRIPDGITFDRLCDTVSINADALDEKDKKAVREELAKQLAEYVREVRPSGSTEGIERKFASKLGYWIYNSAGRRYGLNVLFRF